MPATEEDLIGVLNVIDEEGESGKKNFDKRVEENIDMFRGKQWKMKRNPHFLLNIIQENIERKIGKLSEGKPKIRIMPTRDGLGDAAGALDGAINYIWDRRKVEFKAELIALYGALTGVAFVATPFNRQLAHGRGDIDFMVKDPRSCSFDPSITRADEVDQGEYVRMQEILPIELIRARYPDKARLIQPDARVSTFADKMPVDRQRGMLRSAAERIFGKQIHKEGPIQRVILNEYYVKDRRKKLSDDALLPVVDDLTKSTKDKGVPFPGGRRILRVGNTILEDSWNPYFDGLYPLDMLSWKLDLETAWSADEVQAVKRLQETINRSGDAYAGNLYKNAVVRAVLDYGALTPTERNKLSDMAGQIIEKAPGRQVEIQVPAALPKDALDFIDKNVSWAKMIMGTEESPLQKQVPSIVTGPAIEGLQIMVETPIRSAARRLEEFYQRIGQKMISRVFQFYIADRMLNIIGPTEEWKSFEFKRLELIRDTGIDPKTKQPKGTRKTEEDIRKAWQDFFFAIEPGSSLPITKMQRSMMKMQFVQMGMLSGSEVMEEMGIENAMEKMKKAKAEREAGLGPQNGDQQGGGGQQPPDLSGLLNGVLPQ